MRPPALRGSKPPSLAGLLLLLGASGCASPRVVDSPAAFEPAVVQEWRPPADWASLPPAEFEALVLNELPEDVETPLPREVRIELRAALDRQDESSVRAAVILGRSRHPHSAAILVRRLEARVLGPHRNSDAGDVLAAEALARFPHPVRYAQRMPRLAIGPGAHPDLEVRVECASTALYCGYVEVIPFLLKVLRIGTWEGEEDQRDFAVSDTTTWARNRAATALSLRAGLPLTYRPDGPIASREREARRLERALADDLEAARSQGSTR